MQRKTRARLTITAAGTHHPNERRRADSREQRFLKVQGQPPALRTPSPRRMISIPAIMYPQVRGAQPAVLARQSPALLRRRPARRAARPGSRAACGRTGSGTRPRAMRVDR
jgi:hypothetical protein